MRLKSYFSGTVEAAMELARQELGEEALLVNARPSTPETRYLGAYEVVFGIAPAAVERPAAQPQAEASAPLRLASPESRLADEVAELKRGFAQLIETLAAGGTPARPPAPSPPTIPESFLYSQLLAQDLDPALAQAVAEGTPLDDLYQVDSTLGRPEAPRNIIAFVGPPGVGKTTTLVKLAARYGLTARKPVQILSTDVFRIAAADQLRSLAAILGIGCDIAETPGALAQMLEEYRSKDLIFVDTPGLTRTEMDDAGDLAHFISTHAEIDTHLVLSASMRPSDLARTIDRYAIFKPHKLLFTRIDETSQYGALINEAYRNCLPLSFLAAGQQIPEDLEPATKARLTELILGGGRDLSLGGGRDLSLGGGRDLSLGGGRDLSLDVSEIQPHRKGATA